jgi:hypothetical protein
LSGSFKVTILLNDYKHESFRASAPELKTINIESLKVTDGPSADGATAAGTSSIKNFEK